MKKKLFSLIFLIPVILDIASAQTATNIIAFDFLDLTNNTAEIKLDKGSYQVIINNVNRNLFEVTDSKAEENYNVQVPSILQGIKLPGYFNLTSGQSSVESGNSLTSSTKLLTNLHPPDPIPDLRLRLDSLIEIINYINRAILFNNEIANLLKSCELNYYQIETQKNTFALNYFGINISTPDNAAQQIQNSLTSKVDNGIRIAKDLGLAIENYTGANQAEIKKIGAAAEESSKDLISFKTENKINLIITTFKTINPYNFTYKTPVVKLKKDETTFTITARSKQPLPCNVPLEREFKVTVIKTWGFKMDFSSGLFVSFGDKTFTDNKFYKKEVSDSSIQITTVDVGNRVMPSIGALLHFHFRTGGDFSPAISIGASTSSGFDALNFHAGLSGIIGRKERVVFTIGTTAREVNILDKKFTTGTTYNKKDVPDEIPTNKLFPYFGFFASLTYNIYQFTSK